MKDLIACMYMYIYIYIYIYLYIYIYINEKKNQDPVNVCLVYLDHTFHYEIATIK